jgi:hypothetical protein
VIYGGAKLLARSVAVFLAAASLLVFFAALTVLVTADKAGQLMRKALKRWGTTGTAEPFAVGADAVAKLKESRAGEQKLLFIYEAQQSTLRAEVIQRRRLYQQGEVTQAEVTEAERSLVTLLTRIHETRRALAETDIALTEATVGDELLHMPAPAIDGFRETDAFAHFTGGAKWSLKETPRIEKFFLQTFGYPLPISAFGQTATHVRMRFDHRDALDVALPPDSVEGRALIKFLRASDIPFIAFKSAVPGAATGAHIHIGKPSLRSAAR